MPNLSILFIWVQNEIGQFNLFCMARARKVYPDADFKIITDQKVPFNWMDKISPENLDFKSPKLFSDYARILYLSENPFTLYIDCDVYCLNPVPIDRPGAAKIWAIYNFDRLSLMREILGYLRTKPSPFYYGNILNGAFNNINDYFIHRKKEINNYLTERIDNAGK